MPEWIEEKNQWGGIDRYYIDGFGHKVHERTIDGIPESQYEEFKARERAESLERLKKKSHEKFVVCPFRLLRDCASLKCMEDCALRCADGCGCGVVSDAPLTGGAICPMKPGFKCNPACVLHGVNGCNLRKLNRSDEK